MRWEITIAFPSPAEYQVQPHRRPYATPASGPTPQEIRFLQVWLQTLATSIFPLLLLFIYLFISFFMSSSRVSARMNYLQGHLVFRRGTYLSHFTLTKCYADT